MKHWILKSLLALSLAVATAPLAQQWIGRQCHSRLAEGNCAGGSCGNFRSTQELLDRNTLRFGQSTCADSPETD